MIQVSQTVVIDAPTPEVFAYLDRPENQPKFDPCLRQAKTIRMLPNGGKQVACIYSIEENEFETQLEATKYAPETHVRWTVTGDFTGTIDWTFETVDTRTRFSIIQRYDSLGQLTDVIPAPHIGRYIEKQLTETLDNVRTQLEYDETL